MLRPRAWLAGDQRMVAEGLKGRLDPEFEALDVIEDGRALVDEICCDLRLVAGSGPSTPKP